MKVEVLYTGCDLQRLVGWLNEESNGLVSFEYADEWRSLGLELSPFYLPSSFSQAYVTPTPGFGPLFGLFSDSLPDWWGEQMMMRFFDEKGIPWKSVTPLQKLACTGGHAMGAICYQPPLTGGTFRDELTVEVAELVADAHSFVHGSTEKLLPGLMRSALAPGGAQPKVLLGFNRDFSRAMAGGGHLPAGFSRWLLKFDFDQEIEAAKQEYAYALMADAAGINMAECHLLEGENGACHFLSKRFDRPGESRRHVHTYSGLTHTLVRDGLEYGDLLDVTRKLTLSEKEVSEVFRRACFNVLARNEDDHGKNHAFMMDAEGKWKLTPAYDLTNTTNPLVAGMRAASVNGKNFDITRDDLYTLGQSHGVMMVNTIIGEVESAIDDWEVWAAEAGMSNYQTQAIRDDISL